MRSHAFSRSRIRAKRKGTAEIDQIALGHSKLGSRNPHEYRSHLLVSLSIVPATDTFNEDCLPHGRSVSE